MIHLGVPLPETNISHRTSKLMGWKTSFLCFWGPAYSHGATVSVFRECTTYSKQPSTIPYPCGPCGILHWISKNPFSPGKILNILPDFCSFVFVLGGEGWKPFQSEKELRGFKWTAWVSMISCSPATSPSRSKSFLGGKTPLMGFSATPG